MARGYSASVCSASTRRRTHRIQTHPSTGISGHLRAAKARKWVGYPVLIPASAATAKGGRLQSGNWENFACNAVSIIGFIAPPPTCCWHSVASIRASISAQPPRTCSLAVGPCCAIKCIVLSPQRSTSGRSHTQYDPTNISAWRPIFFPYTRIYQGTSARFTSVGSTSPASEDRWLSI